MGNTAMFNIVCIDDGASAVRGDNGEALSYADGGAAAAAARALALVSGKRYQPRPAKDDSWRLRELGRFSSGTYIQVPWFHAHWFRDSETATDHFLHVSTKEPGKVAFTETPEKGAADLQTRIKPGRYLARFFADKLSGPEIEQISNDFAARYDVSEIHFARTADDIEHVYTHGPSSCMSHAAGRYDSAEHPVRVYAAGDIAIAYLKDDNDRITARAVCWPEKKTYGRVYGDEVRLEAQLEREGFSQDDGCLEGARLLRIKDGSGYVAPYLDGDYTYAIDNGKYLIIGDGDIDLQTTNGLTGSRYTCDCCGEGVDEDDTCGVDGENWCQSCFDNNSFYCDYNEQSYAGDDYVRMSNGQTWSQDAFERHGATCEATDANIPHDDAVTLEDGTVWCQSHFDSNGFVCGMCGGTFALDDSCTACAEKNAQPAIAGRDENVNQLELTLS